MTSRYTISENEVQIWIADLDMQGRDFLRAYLSPSEKARADKFHFQKDRDAYKRARGILRFLLGRYLDVPPADVEILTMDFGKPYVSDLVNGKKFAFNLSYSGSVAIYAFTLGHPVGVDVEVVRSIPDLDKLAAGFFARNERIFLQALEPEARLKPFLNCWTRKEAYLKAIGLGLSISPEEVDVSPLPIPSLQLTSFHPQIKSDQNIWSLMDFEPTDKSVAAIAVDSSVTQVKIFRHHE